MGQRVMFKDRSSREDWRRVKYVNGEITESTPADGYVACGDNAPFSIEATRAQIAELLYRVKDTKFNGGEIAITYTDGFSVETYTILPPSDNTANRAVKYYTQAYQYRGYTKEGDDLFNGDVYDPGDLSEYSDIAAKEVGIRQPCWNTQDTTFIDAFRYKMRDMNGQYETDPEWFRVLDADLTVEVARGHRIAVVKLDPDDDFYASTNRFFLEIEFFFILAPSAGGPTFDGSTSGIFDDGSFIKTHICDYIIRLSPCDGTNDMSCPIYMAIDSATDSVIASDIIHEAIEWWPYKTKAGAAAWDAATGLPINDGPAA